MMKQAPNKRDTKTSDSSVVRKAVQRSWARRLLADRAGAASHEYVLLMGAVGLVLAAAIAGAGPRLFASYQASRSLIVAPTP